MALARAALESLLRARQLERTLTSALPALDPHDEYASGSTGIDALDAHLEGGLPRGQLSEIAGPRASGRSSLMLAVLAAATARGERVALVDGQDMLDVASADVAGVDLSRLLWVRGHVPLHTGPCRDAHTRALTQAVRAYSLALASGVFGVVMLDIAEAPRVLVQQLPFTTWLRLHRLIEGGQTIGLLVGSQPIARSAGGISIRLERQGHPEAERTSAKPRDAIAAWGASGGGAPRAEKKDDDVGPRRQEEKGGAPRAGNEAGVITLRIVRARSIQETALTLTREESPYV